MGVAVVGIAVGVAMTVAVGTRVGVAGIQNGTRAVRAYPTPTPAAIATPPAIPK